MVNLKLTDWEVIEPCTFKQPRADPTFIRKKKKKKKEFADIFGDIINIIIVVVVVVICRGHENTE